VAGEHAGSGGYLGFADPLPYRRTGPGEDASGRPRFDLCVFDDAYFDRLRARVRAAGGRGIHVGVMLWNTWSVHRYHADPALDPWRHHPYNARNNINGVDGDPRGTGDGAAGAQSLAIPAITALQEAYARKVVDTLNDLDNVLYEISNEPIADAATAAWQNHMIGFLRGCQAGRPKRHPIGMTAGFVPNSETINAQLRDSGADWISPALAEAAVHDPPAAEGGKVPLLDTDHLPGGPFDALWMWNTAEPIE
jgi:hypothetical protein